MLKYKSILIVLIIVIELILPENSALLESMAAAGCGNIAAVPSVLTQTLSPGINISDAALRAFFNTETDIAAMKNLKDTADYEAKCLSELQKDTISLIKYMFVGDIHANYSAFVVLLKKAKFINDNLDWIANDKVLVQLGDVVDRGPEEEAEKTWNLLDKLQRQAKEKGGEVVRLIGDHEMLYLNKYYEKYPLRAIDYNGMYLVEKGILKWIDYSKAIKWHHKIANSIKKEHVVAAYEFQGQIVVHAGAIRHFVKDIAEIPEKVAEFNSILRDEWWNHPIFLPGKSRGKADNPYPGIIWADFYKDILPVADHVVPQILAHTPTKDLKIQTAGKDKRVVNIDISLSSHSGGYDAWVFIEKPKTQIFKKGINIEEVIGSCSLTIEGLDESKYLKIVEESI